MTVRISQVIKFLNLQPEKQAIAILSLHGFNIMILLFYLLSARSFFSTSWNSNSNTNHLI